MWSTTPWRSCSIVDSCCLKHSTVSDTISSRSDLSHCLLNQEPSVLTLFKIQWGGRGEGRWKWRSSCRWYVQKILTTRLCICTFARPPVSSDPYSAPHAPQTPMDGRWWGMYPHSQWLPSCELEVHLLITWKRWLCCWKSIVEVW